MDIEATRELKSKLLSEYGSFADKRIKKIDKGNLFIVDDRSDRDFGADKHLYPWFSSMFLLVEEENKIVLMVSKIPVDASVEGILETAVFKTDYRGQHIELTPKNLDVLLKLADAVAAIVGPRKRYDVPSYKYVCPRTADSLRRLHATLKFAWLQ